jgi:hypothetical protein
MYGEEWAKGFVLQCLILHQAHHRGQMEVLMRQAGLKVTGIYGPAEEEWSANGNGTSKVIFCLIYKISNTKYESIL